MPYLFGDLTSYHFSCQTHVPAFLLYETIQIILLTQDGPIYSLPRTRLSFLPCRSPTSLQTRSPDASPRRFIDVRCRPARRMFPFGASLPNGVLPPSCLVFSAEPRSYNNAPGASLRRFTRARRSFAPQRVSLLSVTIAPDVPKSSRGAQSRRHHLGRIPDRVLWLHRTLRPRFVWDVAESDTIGVQSLSHRSLRSSTENAPVECGGVLFYFRSFVCRP